VLQSEVADRATESDQHEGREQRVELVEGGYEGEADPEEDERSGEHAVAVEAVEQPAARERADEITSAQSHEQDADVSDVGARLLPKVRQRRTEHAQRHADDQETDEVESHRARHERGLGHVIRACSATGTDCPVRSLCANAARLGSSRPIDRTTVSPGRSGLVGGCVPASGSCPCSAPNAGVLVVSGQRRR
jgi:hypothetical protein